MWYEILPSLAIVYVFIALPPYGALVTNYLCNNKKTVARHWEGNMHDFQGFLRDKRLTGSEYVPKGLEAIPDGNN